MTDQEQKIMAELKAACETCEYAIGALLQRPCGWTEESAIRIRAARHLASRAVAMAGETLTDDDASDLRAIAEIGAGGAP